MKTRSIILILMIFSGIRLYGQSDLIEKANSIYNPPVGTIIVSLLPWDSFCQEVKINANNWKPDKSKWAPADGRNVKKSLYSIYTGQDNLPDLRGVFLRGLNVFDLRNHNMVNSNQADPDNRAVGSYQSDEFKNHNHSLNGSDTQNNPNSKLVNTGAYGDRGACVSTNINGGSETRPKNVAVYYYIKIN